MRSVNKVILVGNVGSDPSIKSTSGGALIASLSLATSYKTGGKDGAAVVEHVEWHRLKAFKRTAEIIRDYVKKGAALYVEGELKTSQYEKDGQKHYSTEIVIRDLSMLGGNGGNGGAQTGGTGAAPLPATGYGDGTEISDDDIPF